MVTISVIMGVYNCHNYEQIKCSVQSIIDQTYRDWEFIICDDGSDNQTQEILERIEKLDSRIKIIGYDKNRGLAYALNECIKNSKGEFIARMDDDDISEHNRFEKQLAFLKEHRKYDFVGSMAKTFDSNGDLGLYCVPEKPFPKDFKWNSPFIHPTVLMRKTALDKVGGYRVSDDTIRGQDYDLFMRMYGNGMFGYNIQEPLYRYRMVNGGYKKRPLRIRIGEMKVRTRGFKAMGIFWSSIPYVFKPVVLGFVPLSILNRIRKR